MSDEHGWTNTTVYASRSVMVPKTWYCVVRIKDRKIVAKFAGSDDASDWLYGDGERPPFTPEPKDYEIVRIKEKF